MILLTSFFSLSIAFVIGLIVGVFLGVFALSLLSMNPIDERDGDGKIDTDDEN